MYLFACLSSIIILLCCTIDANAELIWIEAESFNHASGTTFVGDLDDEYGPWWNDAHIYGGADSVNNLYADYTFFTSLSSANYFVWVRWAEGLDPGGRRNLVDIGVNINGSNVGQVTEGSAPDITWSQVGNINLFQGGSTLTLDAVTGYWMYIDTIVLSSDVIDPNTDESFTPPAPVVPEPISSTLFIVGGATLGFRRFRRKILN
jgi:hypothetical protein